MGPNTTKPSISSGHYAAAKRRAAQLGYQLVPMVNDHASAPLTPHLECQVAA